MNFGCFIQLEGLKKKWEGLVHISQVCSYVSHASESIYHLYAMIVLFVSRSWLGQNGLTAYSFTIFWRRMWYWYSDAVTLV